MKVISLLFIFIILQSYSYSLNLVNTIELGDLKEFEDRALQIEKLYIVRQGEEDIVKIPKIIEKFKNIYLIYVIDVKLELTEEFFSLPNVEYLKFKKSTILNPEFLENNLHRFINLKDLSIEKQKISLGRVTNQNIVNLQIKGVDFEKKCVFEFLVGNRIYLDSIEVDSILFCANNISNLYFSNLYFIEANKLFNDSLVVINDVIFIGITNSELIKYLKEYVTPKHKNTSFGIRRCMIDKLPDSIFENYLLNKIGLVELDINYIDKRLIKLKNLRYFDMHSNLKELPLFLNEMSKLERVTIPKYLKGKINEEEFKFKIEYTDLY